MRKASTHCLTLLKQAVCCALALARARAGNNKDARMAMMAMTTSNSMSVKPDRAGQGTLHSVSLDVAMISVGIRDRQGWRHLLCKPHRFFNLDFPGPAACMTNL